MSTNLPLVRAAINMDFLEVLEKHRVACEQKGKYEEAASMHTILEQIRHEEEHLHREELRSQHLAERLGVEEAHMKELEEFSESWGQKNAEFEVHARKLEATLAQRHKQAHVTQMDKLQKDFIPRWSKDLLNLRKVQESLAKQKNYIEAGKTKEKADEMEKNEYENLNTRREEKIAAGGEQFLQKQNLEMDGLLKRIQSGREEQKQARKTELDRLLLRYDNVKSQLMSQQKIIQKTQKASSSTVTSPGACQKSAA